MTQFAFDTEAGVLTCRLQGRMDALASQQLERDLEQALAGGGGAERIVFDLAEVDYVASAFLRVCLAAAKQAGAGNFRVVNTSPQVLKIFNIAGLGSLVQ